MSNLATVLISPNPDGGTPSAVERTHPNRRDKLRNAGLGPGWWLPREAGNGNPPTATFHLPLPSPTHPERRTAMACHDHLYLRYRGRLLVVRLRCGMYDGATVIIGKPLRLTGRWRGSRHEVNIEKLARRQRGFLGCFC